MSNSHIYDVSINKDNTLECTNSSSYTKRHGGQKKNKHHYSYYAKNQLKIYKQHLYYKCKQNTHYGFTYKQNKIFWITMSVFFAKFHLPLIEER